MSADAESPFGLREPPFAVAPDPHFAYLAAGAGALIEQLQQEIVAGNGGITVLTGASGSGKTLVAQCLLQRLAGEDVRVARVLHSRATSIELLQSVCQHLRVPMDERVDRDSARDLVNALSMFLVDIYAQGQRVLLVVDEAQNLPDESLEQLRLLTNLETPVHRLMHILLLATPALRDRLHGAALAPLAQRVTAWHELPALDAPHAEAYVRHRMEAAGARPGVFSRLALRDMYRASRGVPRLLNLIGERVLARATERRQATIGERLVQQAAREVLPGHVGYWLRRYRWWWLAGVAVVVVVAVVLGLELPSAPAPAVAPVRMPAVSSADAAAQVVAALPAERASRLQAWSALLARWQVGSDRIGVDAASQCPAVIFAGFNCVGGTGTLDQLKRFDRPLVLVLDTATGQRQVLLLGVGDKSVRLDLGTRDADVPRAILAQLWHGHFFAPFRLPATLPSVIRQGETGAPVAWLGRQLRRLDGDTSGAYRPAVFDAAMLARVKRLQHAFGIPDDGIVGPETLFALMSLDAAGPHLARDVP